MDFHAFRQQPFPAALPTPGKGRPSAFRAHARTKTMLIFPGPFRALQGAFHGVKSGYVKSVRPPVNR
jgi:hypothetical protein